MKALILAGIIICVGAMTDSLASLFLPKPSFTEEGRHSHKVSCIKKLIWFLVAATILLIANKSLAECTTAYAKVGAGYKLEAGRWDKQYRDDPYFVRFEAGVECKRLTFGISHGKQIYNAKSEYFRDNNGNKTALFVDYKHEWGI